MGLLAVMSLCIGAVPNPTYWRYKRSHDWQPNDCLLYVRKSLRDGWQSCSCFIPSGENLHRRNSHSRYGYLRTHCWTSRKNDGLCYSHISQELNSTREDPNFPVNHQFVRLVLAKGYTDGPQLYCFIRRIGEIQHTGIHSGGHQLTDKSDKLFSKL